MITLSTSVSFFQFETDRIKNSLVKGGPQEVVDPQEAKKVEELKRRDAEVRQHESAHLAAAGPYAVGGPRYKYVIGPDGKRYAVSGEVSLDTSEVPNNPEATVRKAQTIKRAALAPADPSMQDRRVAAEATRIESKAQQELAKENGKKIQIYNSSGQNADRLPEPAILDLIV